MDDLSTLLSSGLGSIDFGTSNSMSPDASGPLLGGTNIGAGGITDLSASPLANGINWGSIANGLFGLGGTYINQKANANAQDALGQGLQQMMNQADPFSASRPQYVKQLDNFMANPSSFLQTPYAQSVMQAGSQAVDRSQAAKGYLGSGNEAIALQQHGMSDASGLMQQQFNNLFQLSGAGTGQLAGADIMGNIAGLNAAKATNQASNYNAYAGQQQQSSGGGIGSTLGTLAGSIFGGPVGGGIGGALGGLIDSIF
jgi:hypothetical protein